ncbi:AAWKG family protein [Streptomyces sp. NPDC004726]
MAEENVKPATSHDDYWRDAVHALTGYELPKRGTVFNSLLGNDKIPLMRVEFDDYPGPAEDAALDPVHDQNWRYENAGWRINNTDFLVPFFSGIHGPIGEAPVGTRVKMKRARVTLLGTASTDDPPAGGVVAGTQFTSHLGHDFEEQSKDTVWSNEDLAAYSYGGGLALGKLLHDEKSQPFSWQGIPVTDLGAVDLESFYESARAFDRVALFFKHRLNDLRDWEFDLGRQEASWKGRAAGVFKDIIHGLVRTYESYSEQFPMADKSESVHGQHLRSVAEQIYNAAYQLKLTWDTWQLLTGNPLRFLHDVLVEITDGVWHNNLTKVRFKYNITYNTYGSTSTSGYHYVKEPGFTAEAQTQETSETHGTPKMTSFGMLEDKETWKKIGEEAIRRWQETVENVLVTAGKRALIEVQSALDDHRLPQKVHTETISLSELLAKDQAARARAEAEEEKKKAEEEKKKAEEEKKEAEEEKKKAEEEWKLKQEELERKQAEKEAEQKLKQEELERKQAEKEAEAERKRAEAEAKQEAKQQELERKQAEKEAEQEAKREEAEAKQEAKQQELERKQAEKEAEQEAKREELERKQEAKQAEQEAKQEERQAEAERKQEEAQRRQEEREQQAQAQQMLMMQQARADQERQRKEQEERQAEAELKQEEKERKQEAKQEELERKQEERQAEADRKREELERKQEEKQAEQEAKQEERQAESDRKQAEAERKQEERQAEQEQRRIRTEAEYAARQEEQRREAEARQEEQRREVEKRQAEADRRQAEAEKRAERQMQDPGRSSGSSGDLPRDGLRPPGGYGANPAYATSTLNPNGTVTLDYPDGSSRTINPATGEVVTTLPDGSTRVDNLRPGESIRNSDGTVSRLDGDGRLVTTARDGSVSVLDPDRGTVTTTRPDGSVITTPIERGQTLPSALGSGGAPGSGSLYSSPYPSRYEEELYDRIVDSPHASQHGMGAGNGAGGGMPMMPPGMRMGGGGAGGAEGERVRGTMDDSQPAATRRGRSGQDEQVSAAQRGGLSTASPGMPFMPPMGGQGGGGQQQTESGDRERASWVEEDEDVWGTDEGGAPAVIGR